MVLALVKLVAGLAAFIVFKKMPPGWKNALFFAVGLLLFSGAILTLTR